ncbi:Major facilitator superfamily domain general substrate transporter [Penicillium waksmanii]|uniref:Major facilitator superfamily domain general substrate transporter n=1 Tax=Penicillium waksmanii TaxID=69791 RepID=UPI00254964D5|nr:Major facilitator superfamily domain general substrate transporter [Penicillium waksmanii]KAJ5976365.1 Major facilitator superfamily domain general substrate transporter [Penicillium waksmanii]
MGLLNLSEVLRGTWLITAITVVNACSMAWFGYDQGVFSGVLISADFKKHFPETNDSNISGITSSCFSLGAFFGAIFAFALGDRFGRKKAIVIGLTCNTIGAILQVVSWSLSQMIVGRIINGFGMGLTSSTCPVYQAECSKPNVRGKLVVVGSLSNTAAFCLANWMNFGLYFQGEALQWRFPLGFQLIFPVIVSFTMLFVPESPRWLLLKDRHEEALQTLARLEGPAKSIDDMDVKAQFLSIQSALEMERREQAPFIDVLTGRDKMKNLRRLLLSCGTQFMQQFSGVNALGYYLPTLLVQSVGLGEQESRLLTAINGTTYLCAAFCCLIVIDLFGRRKLMLYGSVGMGSCYFIAAMCLKAGESNPIKKQLMGKVTTAMFFLYYFIYGTSFAKVPWVYNSEVNSLGWRTRGAAAATGTNWICGFIVTQFTSIGVKNLHWRFYLIFAVISWTFFPIVFLFYPETSRRTLEDMDEIFIRNPSLVVCGNRQLTQRERPEEFAEAERQRIAGDIEHGKDGFSISTTTHHERV